jgi:cell division protein FtsW (lipid II flippase)
MSGLGLFGRLRFLPMFLNSTIRAIVLLHWEKGSRYEGVGYNTNQSEIAIGSGGLLERLS